MCFRPFFPPEYLFVDARVNNGEMINSVLPASPVYEETLEYPLEKRDKHKKREDGEQNEEQKKVSIEDFDSDGEVTSFAPLYPVFKFGTRNNDAP